MLFPARVFCYNEFMEHKRLFRSRKNKVFAGIIGGLGEYFETDPVALRVIAVILLVLTGFFPLTLFYFIAYLLILEVPEN